LVGGVRPLVEAAGAGESTETDLGGGRGTERERDGAAGICVFLLHPAVAAVEDEAGVEPANGRRKAAPPPCR